MWDWVRIRSFLGGRGQRYTGVLVVRRLKCLRDCCLSQDLVSFDDPLNLEAAEHYQRDKVNASCCYGNYTHAV